MYSASPIPQTYASLYYLSLGADDFLLSIIGFAGYIAIALVQLPGGYFAEKHGRRWLIATMTFGLAFSTFFYSCAFMAFYHDRLNNTEPMRYLWSSLDGYGH